MKHDDVMDLVVVFCILFVFLLVQYCFCVAAKFSVNKDLYSVMSVSVRLGVFVCPRLHLRNYTSDLRQFFVRVTHGHACLGPPLAAEIRNIIMLRISGSVYDDILHTSGQSIAPDGFSGSLPPLFVLICLVLGYLLKGE